MHQTGSYSQVDALLEGKWRVEAPLGRGGMGTVYLATDLELERQVAIKMLAPEYSDDPDLVARFEREARTLAKLEHPNLVPIFAVGKHEGKPFIVMKKLDGITLREYLKRYGPMGLDDLLYVTKQVCAGLSLMHQRGVVHRDLKPSNIFLEPNGHVSILDLGVAHDATAEVTRAGMLVGTPRYMSPEQIQGRAWIDGRSDLYVLAAVVFELATGKPLFGSGNDLSVMDAHVTQHPPNASDLTSEVPPEFAQELITALSKEPDDRHESVEAFFDALAISAGRSGAFQVRRDFTPRPSQASRPAVDARQSERGSSFGGASQSGSSPSGSRGSSERWRKAPMTPDAPSQMLQRHLAEVARQEASRAAEVRSHARSPAADEEPLEAPDGGASEEDEDQGPRSRASWGWTLWQGMPSAPGSWALFGVAVAAAFALILLLWPSRQPTPLAATRTQGISRAAALPDPDRIPESEVIVDVPLPRPQTQPSAQVPAQTLASTPAATVVAAPPAAIGVTSTGRVPPRRSRLRQEPSAAQSTRERTSSKAEVRVVTTHAGELSWAWLDVDGVRSGATPVTLRLAPGKYNLRLERPGFQPVTRALVVRAGESPVRVQVDLEP